MKPRMTVATVLFVIATSSVASAKARTAYPSFTGERVYVADVPDVYDPVRAEIARLAPHSRQTYYVVVVQSAGTGNLATGGYCDSLYQHWLSAAGERGMRLDEQRSVLIVLGIENRQLAVHAGTQLQAEYGLKGQSIDREIVAPHFIPYAKTGNYAEGLVVLLQKMEDRITQHDAARSRQPEQAAEAGDQSRKNAAAILPEAEQPQVALQKIPSEVAKVNMTPTTPGGQGIESLEYHMSKVPAATDSGLPLPVWIGAGLVVCLLGFVALRRWLHARRQHSVAQQFATFKEQVMRLSATLDALQERHKLLPVNGTDAHGPMTGETLAMYHAAREAIGEYREDWLKLMETWERAEKLIQSETALGTGRFKDAQRILAAAGIQGSLQGVAEKCGSSLDRLEHGHKHAEQALARTGEDGKRLEQQLEAIQVAGIAPDPYRPHLETGTALVERARGLLSADPIGAQAVLAQRQKLVSELSLRMDHIQQRWKEAKQADQALQQAAALLQQRRAEGFLLQEEGVAPDALLAEGRERHGAALQTIHAGDADGANVHLQRTVAVAGLAIEAIDRHVKAKSECERAISARQAELQRLRLLALETRNQQSQLEREFAADSWRNVSAHLGVSGAALESLSTNVEQAIQMSSPSVQHYCAAASLLERVGQEQQRVAGLHAAVGQRLKELSEIRAQCRSKLGEAHGFAGRLGELLRSHSTDRPRSNQRYGSACQSLQQIALDMAAAQPDWVKLSGRLDETRADLEKAERMAREDMQLAEQAQAEIRETEQVLQRAKAFFNHGVAADVSSAEALLVQARSQLSAQAYEEVIQLANRAEQAAKAALDEATRRAQAKQEQLDRERRERDAAAQREATGVSAGIGALSAITSFADAPQAAPAAAMPLSPSAAPAISAMEAGSQNIGTSVSSWTSEPPPPATTLPSGTSQSSW